MASKRQLEDDQHSSTSRKKQDSGKPLLCSHGFHLVSQTQKQRYQILISRNIVSTLFMDTEVLDALGFGVDFAWLLSSLGWIQFMTAQEQTYANLTLEFLSSLEADISTDPGCERGHITFRLNDKNFSLTLAEFNSIFGLPVGGKRIPPSYKEFSAPYFWDEITLPSAPSFSHEGALASHMPNPVFRYLHSIIHESIFANGVGSNSVHGQELLFMWALINDYNLDTGAFFVEHLLKVAHAPSGPIAIGGRVTTIARHLGIDLGNLDPVGGSTLLDLKSCVASGIIVRDGSDYLLPQQDGEPALCLPNPACTTVFDSKNWQRPGYHNPPA